MKLLGICISCFFFAATAFSQYNLVPNPSFEDYNSCPTGISGFSYSSDYTVDVWYAGSAGTSDYFNACADEATWVSVPENLFSTGQPAHTGDAYGGFWTDIYDNNSYDYREYVQAQLIEPLVAGECYYVEFWSAPANQSDFYGVTHATTDAIGAYFDDEKIGSSGISGVLDYIPQIDNNGTGNYISTPGEWTKVCGFFEAEGGEEWICIGNFHNDDETEVVAYEGGSLDASPLVYLFVDDVLVISADSMAAEFLHDTTVCAPFTLSVLSCADSYMWSTGETTQSIEVYESGTYWVQVETSCGPLTDTAEVIFVEDSVISSSTDIHICFTELPYTIEAFGGYDTYFWSTGDTSTSIVVNEAGTYYLSAYTECAHFVDSFVLDVTEPLDIGLDLGPDTLLCAGTWSLTLAAPPGYDAYAWNTGDTSTSITVSAPGNYAVYVYTECEVFNDIISVTIDPDFGAAISLGEDLELCPPAGITSFNLIAAEGLPNYIWNTGDTASSIAVTEPGIYSVTSTLPCSTISDEVVVTLCNEIYIPNAFSPNGDGINDVFEIIIVDPSRIQSFVVYNRWGALVFDGGPGAYQWNGMYNNEVAAMGVYAYVVVYSDTAGSDAVLQGDITLVR